MFDHQDDYNQCLPAEPTEVLKICRGKGTNSILQDLLMEQVLLLIRLKNFIPLAHNSVPTALLMYSCRQLGKEGGKDYVLLEIVCMSVEALESGVQIDC